MIRLVDERATLPFEEWVARPDRIRY
jgi:hypothetical protein